MTDCKKYELTDICVLILEKLTEKYALQIGDKRKYQDFKKQFWHYKAVWEAEHVGHVPICLKKTFYVNYFVLLPQY